VEGASRNQTISDYGIALTYNSHLINWDKDDPESGDPVIQGYFYLLNENVTLRNGTVLQPYWEPGNNTLRVCMQIYEARNSSRREMIRWVLNYTYPMNFANYTPQLSNSSSGIDDVKSWCARPHDWDQVLLPSGLTKAQ